MNLPSHRHIQSGRTYNRIYNPSDYKPIKGPYKSQWANWMDPAIAIVVVAVIATIFATN
jgi:hypothetical protein